MKYSAPFGSADPNAPYVDRDTPGSRRGSVPPGAAIEGPQREIEAVITAAGLVPSRADLTQLLQAIGNLIDAATGGGGDENYVLMTQARSRLPIFPEVLTNDGKLPAVSPGAGIVRVPAGYTFLHRGVFSITTAQTDFVTEANKTYHLRWSKQDGFALKDLADSSYNPSAVAEADARFDSVYDDMLVARVLASASNVPTVIALANKARLTLSERVSGAPSDGGSGSLQFAGNLPNINWARTPTQKVITGNVRVTSLSPAGALDGYAGYLFPPTVTRYAASALVATDWITGTTLNAPDGYVDFNLSA